MIQHAPLFDSKNGRKRLKLLYTIKYIPMAEDSCFIHRYPVNSQIVQSFIHSNNKTEALKSYRSRTKDFTPVSKLVHLNEDCWCWDQELCQYNTRELYSNYFTIMNWVRILIKTGLRFPFIRINNIASLTMILYSKLFHASTKSSEGEKFYKYPFYCLFHTLWGEHIKISVNQFAGTVEAILCHPCYMFFPLLSDH